MRPSLKRRPSDYLNPDLNPERVARMWGVIEAQQGRAGRTARPKLVLAFVAACAALGCLLLILRWPGWHAEAQVAAATGDVIVTQQKSSSLNLPDGSALLLSESAKLAVVSATASDVSLHLERGRVACEVTHREGRHFTVEALGIRVQVKGTHFTVEVTPSGAQPSQVAVHVDRGVVEVRDAELRLLATMTAGQSWSGTSSSLLPVPSVEASAATAPAVANAASVTAPIVPPAAPVLDADALFERANAARIGGRAADAAADYDRFRLRFPGDARAGLAAFELGRIRLDSLSDPRRALGALRFALAHNRGGFVAEDAEALQIDALARLGDRSACVAARAAFLSAHPSSAHAPRVSRACPDG